MKNYLIIGLGSMGKRRIRCLMKLGVKPNHIYGIDVREDRRVEAEEKYGINIADNAEDIDFSVISAVIVSLPPDKHFVGAELAIKNNKPVFIEASVVLEDTLKIKEYNVNDVFAAPSKTMLFHPIIKEINRIVKSGKYGKVCNFSYHSGQYLPDWHPWENVKDFYVSNRITGGAREIVPFELTWITDVFGFPRDIAGYHRKTRDLGCDIEDSYACVLDYGDMVGNLMVDVVGRFAARNLIVNLERAQLQWRWDKTQLEIFEAETKEWKIFSQPGQIHESGYNENINEDMYIEEIQAFLRGIDDRQVYGNTIEKDIEILRLLERVERSL